ncbi:MAG: hypothetical protein HOP21_06030 [Methylotenera sp.]|nr:hypothetical protein [Methylotenera sp.]
MNSHQTLAVTVRLFAIWLFLYYLSTTVGLFIYKRTHIDTLAPLLIGLSGTLLICGLLWYFPTSIAKKILPNASISEEAQKPLFDGWFSVGCSLIGVWVLATAIPALGSYVIGDYLGQRLYPDSYIQNPEWSLLVAFNFLKILVGLWLFLGAKGLKKIIHWAKYT